MVKLQLNFLSQKLANFSKIICRQNQMLTIQSFHYNRRQKSLSHTKSVLNTLTDVELKQKFESVAPELVTTLTQIEYLNEIPQVKEIFQKLLNYNLFDGKKTRGLQTVIAHQLMTSQVNAHKLKLVCLLGWCVELAFYLVHDDIIDGSELRRGRVCWYRLQENGLNAVNDGVILENSIYVILQKYFKNMPYYVNLIESFHEAAMKTSVGQVLDTQISKSYKLNKSFDQFTPQNYFMIVKYKTAYYSFQLPVITAMCMAGITEKIKHENATNILLRIGQYYQIQDDFLDCFGDKISIGKSGNDIAEGKCTWLIVNALQRANRAQMEKLQVSASYYLKENYGNSDPEKIQAVIQIYNEIGLQQQYDKYEKQVYNELMSNIDNLPKDIKPEIFTQIIDKIYRRKC